MKEGSDRKLEFTVVGDDPMVEADQSPELDFGKSDSGKLDSGKAESGEIEVQLVYLAETEPRALGTTMRDAREQRGATLREAAGALRIRSVYIEAIETGRFNDLPGGVYASGFIRSYANYLNLDAEEVLRRFKACGSGFDAKTELAFPVPLPESRIPKGAIILASLFAAAMIYGVWYSMSRPDPAMERVPEVPERMVTTLDETAPDKAAVDEAATDEAAVEVAPTPVVSVEALAQEPEVEAAPVVEPAPVAEAAPVVEPAPVAVTEAPPQEPEVEAGTGTEVGVVADSRILLRATRDVWVHVGDPRNGEVFFNRTMKSGEIFQVPGGKKLTLMTGNAGALEVLVDGERAPRLGPSGAVLRLVTLEAGRLRVGTAVVR